jgi:predicted PurR-regulated permease PerM
MWIKTLFSFLFILFLLNFILSIVSKNALLLANSLERYEDSFLNLVNTINTVFEIDLMDEVKSIIANYDFKSLIFSVFNFSAGLISSVFLVLIYTIFLFLEEASFKMKFRKLFQGSHLSAMNDILKEIENSVMKYLGIKTLLSLITATLSYIILLSVGVDFPVFWAFIVFLFNYIPFIGSIVATLFPVVFSYLQFGAFIPSLLILIFLGSVQVLIGNFLDPKLTGDTVNISPIVVILSLAFWGAIWGIAGMLLSVPLMSIIIIILSKFEKTKPIAIILSGDRKNVLD